MLGADELYRFATSGDRQLSGGSIEPGLGFIGLITGFRVVRLQVTSAFDSAAKSVSKTYSLDDVQVAHRKAALEFEIESTSLSILRGVRPNTSSHRHDRLQRAVHFLADLKARFG